MCACHCKCRSSTDCAAAPAEADVHLTVGLHVCVGGSAHVRCCSGRSVAARIQAMHLQQRAGCSGAQATVASCQHVDWACASPSETPKHKGGVVSQTRPPPLPAFATSIKHLLHAAHTVTAADPLIAALCPRTGRGRHWWAEAVMLVALGSVYSASVCPASLCIHYKGSKCLQRPCRRTLDG